MTLLLECVEEKLSPAQVSARKKIQEQCNKVKNMLDSIVKDYGGSLISQTGSVSGYQYSLPTGMPSAPGVVVPPKSTAHTQVIGTNVGSAKNSHTIKFNMLNNAASQNNIQLVMDARTGVLLGAPQGANVPTVCNVPSNSAIANVTSVSSVSPAISALPQKASTIDGAARPSEQTSIGGIMVGSKKHSAEALDDAKKGLPDSREITFNKMNGGRTYPSLVVVARPNLRVKNLTSQMIQKERSDLDVKVKGILMYSATKFTEWLIQQGLVRSEQICQKHSNNSQKRKLKLGMYSDVGTFPFSGGYVWISNCCQDRYVSVFFGSIFQSAPYSPTILLKLIYHWACQTNVQNVISWVKVSNLYVKTFYANLRSICTSSVWDKCKKIGGKNSMIQVGVISLGTTSQDGNLRQVKVEVLGILDPETLELRLRACEPVKDGERSYKKRFNNILSPLIDWVDRDSKILTDFTVDKTTLYEMGFHNVVQSAFSDQNPKNISSNYHIMEYLRKIVPRMFQNTLSLLSRPMIQQFLDELVWREMYGTTPLRAFENIIIHIAEQTKLEKETLLERLTKVADNPFANWIYSNNSSQSDTRDLSSFFSNNVAIPISSNISADIDNSVAKVSQKKSRKRPHVIELDVEATEPKVIKESKSTELVPLQELYYATMEGESLKNSRPITFSLQCFLCSSILRSNTEVMEHMINHVPPLVPGQSESPVCRYCCTAFSSKHQMNVHITEAHSNFGQTEGDMLVCGICELKFGTSILLSNHLSSTHYPSEMPYQCNTCNYRTSSHKDVIDHYYDAHKYSDGLQCPHCLKIVQVFSHEAPNLSAMHTYLTHMQRHIIRRTEKANKCPRCCLWFNQRSSLKNHIFELHKQVFGSRVIPYTKSSASINVPRSRHPVKRIQFDEYYLHENLPEKIRKWIHGPIKLSPLSAGLSCKECEEDVSMKDHFPGEQECDECRYVTCCWRAYKEHKLQVHNERPLTCVIVPSPLINIPLDKEMQCLCGYKTRNGNHLASHLVKCDKSTAYKIGNYTNMLDSLGLIPKSAGEQS